jgi:hypothetical protein
VVAQGHHPREAGLVVIQYLREHWVLILVLIVFAIILSSGESPPSEYCGRFGCL